MLANASLMNESMDHQLPGLAPGGGLSVVFIQSLVQILCGTMMASMVCV